MDPTLLQIASFLAANGASEEKILETLKIASSPNPYRLLTDDERDTFAGAVARAVRIMPAFRDAVALIRPFRDYTTPTLYTDKSSRVGIGEAFFLDGLSSQRRATLLLHESMHVLNNHFTRMVDFPIDPSNDNNAKDLEINSLLNRDPRTDLEMLLLPSSEPFKFPEAKSYEQYAKFMKEKGMLGEDGDPQGKNPQPKSDTDESMDGEKGDPSESNKSDSESVEGSSETGDGDPENSESSKKASDGKPDGSSDSEESDDESEGGGAGGDDSKDDSTDSDSSDGSKGSDSSSDSEPSDSDSSGGSESSDGDSESNSDSELEDAAKAASNKSTTTGKSIPNSSCDHSTSEREKAADDLKVEPASSAEQSVARNNTVARLQEEAKKARERGDRAALMMLQQMELTMGPSKVNWRTVFRNLLTNCRDSISLGRSDYTYRRVNKRLSSGEFIFPGMVKYEPTVMMGIDTSGSMAKKDLSLVLSELESIVKSAMRSKDKFRAFCVDAAATEPKTVRSIRDLDLRGGGGTAMEVSIRSIELLPRKDHPDLFILATDGGTSWPAFKREMLKRKGKYRVLVLITEEAAFSYSQSELRGVADVIDLSDVRNEH